MAATTARRARIAATVSAVLLSGSLLGASAAEASTAAYPPHRPFGTVTAKSGLNVRQYPSTDSSVLFVLPFRAQRGLDCKVRAQNIEGNTLWYKLRNKEAWVTARFMDNTGFVPFCKDVHPTAASSSMKSQEAMG
ncbi:MAG: SH3 domain-containing protein [Streptomyces sp.]|uniref:SH3 domain-containing protein n=1 Tax=Streptomyces sp. TaxID=1931 RepID=UPI003D6B7318